MKIRDLGNRPASQAIREFFSRVAPRRSTPIKIERQAVPYWQQQGWTHNGQIYEGSYQTPYGAFRGYVLQRSAREIEFSLYQPSNEIRGCSHWPCFQHVGNEWYAVHMARRPADVSSGILSIERLIVEAYEDR
jgi:hypothetical protein